MRKIGASKNNSQKIKMNKLLVGLFLVFTMVISTIGFSFFSSPSNGTQKEEYNGIEFELNENGFWGFELGGQAYQTS